MIRAARRLDPFRIVEQGLDVQGNQPECLRRGLARSGSSGRRKQRLQPAPGGGKVPGVERCSSGSELAGQILRQPLIDDPPELDRAREIVAQLVPVRGRAVGDAGGAESRAANDDACSTRPAACISAPVTLS